MFFTHSIFVFPSVSLLHPLPPPPLKKKYLAPVGLEGPPYWAAKRRGGGTLLLKTVPESIFILKDHQQRVTRGLGETLPYRLGTPDTPTTRCHTPYTHPVKPIAHSSDTHINAPHPHTLLHKVHSSDTHSKAPHPTHTLLNQ